MKADTRREDLKVAVVHEMLIKMGGAENVVSDILEIYPEADLYTLIHDDAKVSKMFPKSRIKQVPRMTQFMFRAVGHQRFALPFMARAIESIDLSGYDLVISSSSTFAHGCVTKPETLFAVYYHTPSRYLWDWTHENRKELRYGFFFKKLLLVFLEYIFHGLRMWDYLAGQRGDLLIANSKTVQKRIEKYYRRDSHLIYPSVYTDIFSIGETPIAKREYYIIVGALTEFKRIDIAVNAFNRMPEKRLLVIGDGKHRKHLESIAKDNIEFVGYKHWEESNEYYRNAKGAILCNIEDFGIIPLEAMCAGVPVFGLRRGGLTETSMEGLTGEFFDDVEGSDFIERFRIFEEKLHAGRYDSQAIRKHAMKFSKERFKQEFKALIDANLKG